MEINKRMEGNTEIAVVYSEEFVITDVQSALDFIMTIQYETGCYSVVLNKEAIVEDFFDLKTRIAGEILQKFVNYHTKFAIYGDFSKYTSKSLKDFIYECNNGNNIFFADTKDDAVAYLS